MEYHMLGNTGLNVSRLCFGTLVMGPLQANLPVETGAELIVRGMCLGINFIDTAELYGTYGHIACAIRAMGGRKPIIVSKTYAYTAEDARASVEKARREMNVDVVDIFMLHEQESRLTLRGHRPALDYLCEARAKGIIKAVGVSTHNVEVVEAAAEIPEIEVIHPLINKAGLGIGDGGAAEMLAAIKKAKAAGKGIYGMKVLGGGNLISGYDEYMKFALGIEELDSIAMGMQTVDEIEANVAVFEGRPVPEDVLQGIRHKSRTLHVDYWCEGCGMCVERCKQGALSIVAGRLEVDTTRCVMCSYCASVCKCFAIKVV